MSSQRIRKYLSGCQKRKLSDKKEKGTMELQKNQPKMDSWLHNTPKTTQINSETQVSVTHNQHGNIFEIPNSQVERMDTDAQAISEICEKSKSSPERQQKTSDRNDTDNINLSDAGLWPDKIDDKFIQLCVKHGPKQEDQHNYPKNIDNRSFSSSYYFKIMPNGEKQNRTWLVYSNSKNSVFCFCCVLFSKNKDKCTRFTEGFSHWRKLSAVIRAHEVSNYHISSFIAWQELLKRLKLNSTIDVANQKNIHKETERLRLLFRRIVDVLLFLSNNNLPLRGTHEIIGVSDNGNFLSLIELLSKYDTVLMDHVNLIKNSRNRIVHHLAHKSQEQFLAALSQEVLDKIKSDVQSSSYFSIQMDCTPDISHTEQTSVILRYVNLKEKKLIIKESFVGFIEVTDTTGKGLAETLLKKLTELDLDIMKCRGQGYDNGSNMKGKYKGVQSRIIEMNRRALYVPCLSHSFNLLICDAACSSIYCKNFFGIVQRLYALFSASTKRWEIMKKHLKISLKPLCETRWEAKIDSVKALYCQFEEACEALEELIDTCNDNKVVSESQSLLDSLQTMTFILSLTVWYTILSKINIVNKSLQSSTITLDSSLNLINNVKNEMVNMRSEFDSFFDKAKEMAQGLNISDTFPQKRLRKKKKICLVN